MVSKKILNKRQLSVTIRHVKGKITQNAGLSHHDVDSPMMSFWQTWELKLASVMILHGSFITYVILQASVLYKLDVTYYA